MLLLVCVFVLFIHMYIVKLVYLTRIHVLSVKLMLVITRYVFKVQIVDSKHIKYPNEYFTDAASNEQGMIRCYDPMHARFYRWKLKIHILNSHSFICKIVSYWDLQILRGMTLQRMNTNCSNYVIEMFKTVQLHVNTILFAATTVILCFLPFNKTKSV